MDKHLLAYRLFWAAYFLFLIEKFLARDMETFVFAMLLVVMASGGRLGKKDFRLAEEKRWWQFLAIFVFFLVYLLMDWVKNGRPLWWPYMLGSPATLLHSWEELLVILVIVILILGVNKFPTSAISERLPRFGIRLGKWLGEGIKKIKNFKSAL